MTTTITDAFDLPRSEDIRAMGFVVKLREADPGSDEVKQLVDDYVITLFSAGHTQTFPLWVFGVSRLGIPPEVNVLGTLILLVAVAFILVQLWSQRRAVVAKPVEAPA